MSSNKNCQKCMKNFERGIATTCGHIFCNECLHNMNSFITMPNAIFPICPICNQDMHAWEHIFPFTTEYSITKKT